MDFAPTIKRIQEHLGLKADGVPGRLTWEAISKALGIEDPPALTADEIISAFSAQVDPRSESNIDGLLPIVRPFARQLIAQANEELAPKTVKITSGYRTFSEQNELYEQGRSKPGKIVSNARGGYSNHNFALAFDVTLFDEEGKPIWESALYKQIGRIGRGLGLIWGGDWNTPDEPHFELRPEWAAGLGESEALAEYRERQKKGIALV